MADKKNVCIQGKHINQHCCWKSPLESGVQRLRIQSFLCSPDPLSLYVANDKTANPLPWQHIHLLKKEIKPEVYFKVSICQVSYTNSGNTLFFLISNR